MGRDGESDGVESIRFGKLSGGSRTQTNIRGTGQPLRDASEMALSYSFPGLSELMRKGNCFMNCKSVCNTRCEDEKSCSKKSLRTKRAL